jgi:hypothetical protein
MSETLVVAKRGRPRKDPDDNLSAEVRLRVTPAQYDCLYAQARQERISIPDLVRSLIFGTKNRTVL